MNKIYTLTLIVFLGISFSALSQAAATQNYAFQPQEKIIYNVYYNVIGIYINAGTATFTTFGEKWQNKDVYHVVATGTTNPKYDWIFKVRDRYESWFNTNDLQPVKFSRHINEGKYSKQEEITFNQQTNTAITQNGVYRVPENIQDVVSIMYYARNIDYNKYNKGDKIPFSMFLDDKIYDMYIHYEGKETIKTKYGKFNAIKLKPLLLKGTIFKGGEMMTIWVTDDANHLPVRAESPIIVGSVKIDLMHYENLKFPLIAMR